MYLPDFLSHRNIEVNMNLWKIKLLFFTLFFTIASIILFNIFVLQGILFLFICFIFLFFISIYNSRRFENRYLFYIIIIAFLIRALFALFTSTIFLLDKLYLKDALNYHIYMKNLADSYTNFGSIQVDFSTMRITTYSYLGSFIYFIFGKSMLVMKILNSFLGSLLIIVIYRTMLLISNKKAATISSIIICIWPSMIFWSSQNLRDSMIALFLYLIIYNFLKIIKERKLINYLFFISSLIVLILLRNYIGYTISIIVLIFILLKLFSVKGILKPISYIFGILILFFFISYIIRYIPILVKVLGTYRHYLAQGGSAFLTNFQLKTFGEMLGFLPLGAAYFLFAPFPGQAENIMQLFSSLENFLFYFLLFFSILGTKILIKQKKLKLILFPILVFFLISILYGLLEGNLGTAYRHKMQILPIVIMFSSHALSEFKLVFKGK